MHEADYVTAFINTSAFLQSNFVVLRSVRCLSYVNMAHDGPKDINTVWTYGYFTLFVLVDISNDVHHEPFSIDAE